MTFTEPQNDLSQHNFKQALVYSHKMYSYAVATSRENYLFANNMFLEVH